MPKIEIYSADYCPYCTAAKELLDSKGATYTVYEVADNQALRAEAIERSGRRTVPQIFIDDQHIGGYDDLSALDSAGKLDPLLKG